MLPVCLAAGHSGGYGTPTNWAQTKAESTTLDRQGLVLPPKCLSLALLYFLSF